MIHYEMTKKDSLIYADDGAFGVVMVRPYKKFESGFVQLPSIKVVEPEHFRTYYNSHEARTISKTAFEKIYMEVSAHILDFDRTIGADFITV